MASTTFKVYSYTDPNGVPLATLTTVAAPPTPHAMPPQWRDPIDTAGVGRLYLPSDAAELVADPDLFDGNIVKIEVDGTERFAYIIEQTPRWLGDTWDLIEVAGRGIKALLETAQVYPEYGLDRMTPRVRMFGFMAAEFNDSGWGNATSQGTQANPTPGYGDNPVGWPDPDAHWIWDRSGVAPAGDCYFRRQFYIDEDTDTVLFWSSDDEMDLWVDGERLTPVRGPFQWTRTFQEAYTLEAGLHTVAIRGRNLERPNPDTNAAGVIFTIARALSDGSLEDPPVVSVDEVQDVWVDANGGTFTLTFEGATTDPISYDASALTVRTALEALDNIDGVSVTGVGTQADPWQVTFDGWPQPGDRNVDQMTGDATNLILGDVQQVYNDATGGTFTLTFDGQTTADIAFDASAATIASRLEALSNIVDVSVTGVGNVDDPWEVTFRDPAGDQPQMTADDTGLSGGTTTITTVTDGGTPTVNITTVTEGVAPTIILHTDTDWKIDPYPDPPPGMTPGEVMRILVEEAQVRGVLGDVTLGFTDTHDSAGNAWTVSIDHGYPVQTDMLKVADQFAALGVDVAMTPGLQLDMWEGRGADLSATVTLERGQIVDGYVPRTVKIRNSLLVETMDGYSEAEDATSVGAYGRREMPLRLGTFEAAGATSPATGETLSAYKDPVAEPTIGYADTDGPQPYDAYDVGDIITAPGWDGQGARRCFEIVGKPTPQNQLDWEVTFQ